MATTSFPAFLCSFLSPKPLTPKSSPYLLQLRKFRKPVLNSFSCNHLFSAKRHVPEVKHAFPKAHLCYASRRKPTATATSSSEEESDEKFRRVLQIALWVAEGVYILWLFLLPYAPGDPVWAISSDTLNSLLGLSLNFFLILPIMNFVWMILHSRLACKHMLPGFLVKKYFTQSYSVFRVVGIHLIDAPVLHPMSEGLFNFVIGWTFMFAPLLFTDRKKDRYKGSLDVLWGLQMFLTNTFLIPYMAIRLNDADDENAPRKLSQLGSLMTNGAQLVGAIGGGVCLISLLWALFGRMDANFGGIGDRWDYLVGYLGSERLAYAFIWDICLYMIFQPWLIGDNLQNVQENKVVVVKYLRYVPVVGLIAYLLCLEPREV